ncbi:sulfotransferase [Microbulbifer sp. SA54]|uniref:tetratricopeptide repeat-containing sulfotransferase family protein n=1 Tax=Microbulbifer sp. SA54 TaxID=3401577 RepID=UPI003AAE5ACE
MAVTSNQDQSRYRQAVQLFRDKSFEAALVTITDAIEHNQLLESEVINAGRLQADILLAQGEVQCALAVLNQTLGKIAQGHPAYLPVMLHRASILLRAGDIAGAARLDYSALMACSDVTLLAQAGYIYALCEQHEKALQVYRAALRLDPDQPQLLFNLASACRAMGLLDESETLYNRVIARKPQDWEAYKNRSDLRTQTPQRNNVDSLKALISSRELPMQGRVQLSFALAKELEDLGHFEESFHFLAQGCAARRAGLRYDLDKDLSVMHAIRETYDAGYFRTSGYSGEEGKGIIFILGMPRTGTTLVDRILTAASGVVSAGEPDTFARYLTEMVVSQRTSEIPDKPAFVRASGKLDFARLGQRYAEQLNARAAQRHASIIIDKNPMNFLYAGLIQRALPGARIIHLRRGAMDTCYAIYKTLFKTAYPFSYDLDELGRYYLAYRDLMAHWHRVIPGCIYDLDYEALVQNPESEARKLLEYCGLSWQDAVLDFHRNRAQGTATASAAQVRQPMYTSSIGKWRRYERQLAPLIHRLQQGQVGL